MGHAPENTLAGIEAALKLGADGIEIDVHCTADGVPVLLHDDTVDRSTDGTGNVHDMAWADARKLIVPAGEFAPAVVDQHVPYLGEALELVRGKALLVIEIKQAGIEEAVVRVVREAGAAADCEAHAFAPGVVRAMREAEPRMAAALLTIGNEITDWPAFFDEALSQGAQGVSIHGAYATAEVVRAAQRRSLTVTAWMVDEERHARRAHDAGVDRLCTNFPGRARHWLAGTAS
jgi:glycerophosphoryl diester phosphodiesterase